MCQSAKMMLETTSVESPHQDRLAAGGLVADGMRDLDAVSKAFSTLAAKIGIKPRASAFVPSRRRRRA